MRTPGLKQPSIGAPVGGASGSGSGGSGAIVVTLVNGIVTAAYANGTGTLIITKTPKGGGATTDVGAAQTSPATYPATPSDRNYVFSARPATASVPAGALNPSVAPLAPTITALTAAAGSVTATFTRNADNGGDTVTGDRLRVYNAGTNAQLKQTDGTNPITATGLQDGIPVYAKVATLGQANGEGPMSSAYGPVTVGAIPVTTTVGPYTLGSVYTSGGRNYTATTGDDFSGAPSFITPGDPMGRYSTTRSYQNLAANNGPRGNNSGALGLKGYDADVFHTGHNDYNRGNAITSYSDIITASSGRLQLKSRAATTAERNSFADTAITNVSSMIGTATSHLVMAPFFIEAKMKLTKSQLNTRGWHPSFWLMQAKSVGSWVGTELDWEATSLGMGANKVSWASGVGTGTNGGDIAYVSGVEYTFRIEVLAGGGTDGAVNWSSNVASGGGNGALNTVRSLPAGTVADTSRPFYAMLTNHIANFGTDSYDPTDWAGGASAVIDVDYFAIATTTGTLYQPQVANTVVNVNFGDPINIALPSAATMWGSAVAEDIESWAQESNEPGGSYSGGYLNKVPGLTYDLTALTISGTPSGADNKSGRIMACRYTKVAGAACIPHRTVINVGPRWLTDRAAVATVGQPYSFDLYAQADCGQLVSDVAGARAKTIQVTGLPLNGLSYNDATGLITGTPTATIDTTITATVTNSVGQVATVSMGLVASVADAAIPAPTLTGSPTIRNSWDFNNLSSLTIDNSLGTPHIMSAASVDGGTLALANATVTAAPTRELRNGRYAARFARGSSQYLQGSAAQAYGGTQVIIFEPTNVSLSQQIFERSRAASANTANREGLIGILGSYVGARRANASASADAQSSPSLNTTALHIAVAVFDPTGTGITLYFDGASVGTTASLAHTGELAMDTVTLGGRMAAGAAGILFDGYVHRVIDYSTVLNATQAEQIAVWAKQQYGTPNLA